MNRERLPEAVLLVLGIALLVGGAFFFHVWQVSQETQAEGRRDVLVVEKVKADTSAANKSSFPFAPNGRFYGHLAGMPSAGLVKVLVDGSDLPEVGASVPVVVGPGSRPHVEVIGDPPVDLLEVVVLVGLGLLFSAGGVSVLLRQARGRLAE